jgi:hypothetical protein
MKDNKELTIKQAEKLVEKLGKKIGKNLSTACNNSRKLLEEYGLDIKVYYVLHKAGEPVTPETSHVIDADNT